MNYQGQPPQQPGGPQQQQQAQFQAGTSYGQAPNFPNMTSLGISPNIAAGLCYSLCWVSGLVILLLEQQNRVVRFHALQSIFFFGTLTAVGIALAFVPFVGWCIAAFLPLIGFFGWLILMACGFAGVYIKLPVFGHYAEHFANQGP